jgi:N-acetylated-alpha-linked acidic dipeptidase
VELVAPQSVPLKIEEKGYPEDPDTMNPDVGIPYNAYSRSGDITAPLLYANGGNPEDYDWLEKRGIDLKGKIALVRYSSPYSYRGFKALTAEKRGLAGLLIYSDPNEDGEARGPVFPDGPWGPLSHIQRGGIPYDFIYPGDPLTPEWASKPGGRRLSPEEAETLPKIISVPLSAENARPLLDSMDGEVAPPEWQGAFPLTYRLSGSQTKVRIIVEMEDPIKSITNVIGCLKGTESPEEVILVGNHRDAWVYGGHDPSSGTACLLELTRVLGEAKRAGFKPRRTVIFGNWDAEEFTLTGSTEWGEENKEWLRENLVAYINVDSSASGRDFSIQGVPSLIPLVHQALKEVEDPIEKKPVYEIWKSGGPGRTEKKEEGRVEPIGSGSDNSVFLNHIGAPALDMSFSGDYGVYHSAYDNYYWMTHFGDPGMLYTAALAKIWAYMIIDLACEPVLPLDFEGYAQELQKYLADWAEEFDPGKKKAVTLFALLGNMEKAASRIRPYLFDSEKVQKTDPDVLKSINRLLLSLERDFTDPAGIPGRPWYKHLIFGARYTYAVLLLPALTEASEAGDERSVDAAIKNLEKAVAAATAKIEQIAALAAAEANSRPGLLVTSCPSTAKKSGEELARQGIEFSEKAFFQRVRGGQTEVVRLFLLAGMSPDVQDKGFTPLLEAARRGYSEMALELIKGGADVNAKDPYGVTVLMFSLIAGSTDVALKLIEKGAEVNSRDTDGRTALVEALTSENEIPPEILESLIRRGADVNVRLAGGLTPLMIAASGAPRIVRLLVEAGADIKAKDDNGADALQRAKDNPENIRVLEEAQAGLPAVKKEESP